MSEERPVRHYGEKAEKQEKEDEKQEKGRHEKSWDEKWRRDPLSAAVWAIVVIWAGLVLLASNLELLRELKLEPWPLFFLGAGCLLLLEVAFRLLVPAYRAPVGGTVILGFVFLAIGLGGMVAWWLVWAVALIGIGVVMLLRGLLGGRR